MHANIGRSGRVTAFTTADRMIYSGREVISMAADASSGPLTDDRKLPVNGSRTRPERIIDATSISIIKTEVHPRLFQKFL